MAEIVDFLKRRLHCAEPKKIIIWTCGMFVLVGLLGHQVIPLVHQYYHKNNASQLEIITQNETIKPPSLTVCIPYSPTALTQIAKHLLKNHTTECDECIRLAKSGFMDLTDLKSNANLTGDAEVDKWEVARVIIEKMQHTDLSAMHVNNSDWNQPIIEAVWDLFTGIGALDNVNGTLEPNNSNEAIQRRRVLSYNVEELLSKKEQIDYLYKLVVSFLCEHIHIGANAFENQCVHTLTTNSSHPFHDQFCFKMTYWYEGFNVTVNSLSRRGVRNPALEDIRIPFQIYSGTDVLMWPLSNEENSDALFASEVEHDELRESAEIVYLNYMVESSVVAREKDKTCYNSSNYASCLGLCRDEERVRCYKCVPFTFRKNADKRYPDLPYCNTTRYNTRCWDFEAICKNKKCITPCRYISYQYHITRNVERNRQSRVFTLKARKIDRPFVQFTFIKRQTKEQLVASVAGMFNLYLGFSGIAVVSLIVKFLDSCKKGRKQKLSSNMSHEFSGISILTVTDPDFYACATRGNPAQVNLDLRMAQLERSVRILERELENVRKYKF